MAKKVKRPAVGHVWIAEGCYKYSRWITFWMTTCRLTKREAKRALAEYQRRQPGEYEHYRLAKFTRRTEP